jgi:hypothetical protein
MVTLPWPRETKDDRTAKRNIKAETNRGILKSAAKVCPARSNAKFAHPAAISGLSSTDPFRLQISAEGHYGSLSQNRVAD